MGKNDYYPGDAVNRYYYFRDKDNVPIDPDTVSCDVYDPDDVKIVPSPTLTKVVVGKYEFNYVLESDAATGGWHVVVSAVKAGYSRVRSFGFQVVALP